MDVLQRVEISVPASARAWLDSGVTLRAGESLRITASGAVRYDAQGKFAFPEGSYVGVGEGKQANHAYEPARVDGYVGGSASRFLVSNLVPHCLAAVVRASAPPWGMQSVSDALRSNRDTTFAPPTLPPAGGRVWLAFNDAFLGFSFGGTDPFYADNRGVFGVVIERIGPTNPLLPGRVSPIRFVPPDIAREKRRSVENTAVCWFIRPKYGPPEGYTEMDFPVACPPIAFATGAADDGTPLYTHLPALEYRPFSGLSISNVPTSIKLGVDAPDVTLVNFDHTKLRREYYEAAQVEVFEVPLDGDRSKPLLYLSGVLGNCQGDDLSATIELTPWDELTNLPVGWKMGFMCDVGRPPGEEFGTKRCLNEKRFNGIDIANWTRGARVSALFSLSRLVIAPQTVGGFGGFESAFPGSHGIIQFVGGALDGLRRDVGKFDASTGILTLRRALPTPGAGIGAQMLFKAGCDRTFDGPQGCIFWQQGRNFRGTPHLPGRKALTRLNVI